ncbi:MAG: DNA repair protein RadC [Methanoregulaceae archaeon]|nr:DNA repair protein RadC [Methanoregulaceae archaeon]
MQLPDTMKKMRDLPDADRPREKIARNGAGVLTDRELIAAIVGSGTREKDVFEISKEILGHFGNNPGSLTFRDLIAIPGVGPTKAAQIAACLEIGRRHFGKGENGRTIVTRPEDVLPLVEMLRGKKQEYFICLTLSGAGEVLENRTVTVGLLNHSLVHPREVYADAITDRAASIICVHNHPSGSLEPSDQDIAITRQLAEAGGILGIRLLDHIIITKQGHLSMKERGLI